MFKSPLLRKIIADNKLIRVCEFHFIILNFHVLKTLNKNINSHVNVNEQAALLKMMSC